MSIEVISTFAVGWAATRYVVDPWASRVEPRVLNMIDAAHRKARGRPLELNERTVIKAVDQVAWSDEAIIADYLGGVIASSTIDDAGVPFVEQIGRLSSTQLALHYVIYRQLWRNEAAGPGTTDLRSHQQMATHLELFLSLEDLDAVLHPDRDVYETTQLLLSDLHVLAREDLIAAHATAGPTDLRASGIGYLVESPSRLAALRSREVPFAAVACRPTPPGIELFLRGCGSEQRDPTHIRQLPEGLVQARVGDVSGGLMQALPLAQASTA